MSHTGQAGADQPDLSAEDLRHLRRCVELAAEAVGDGDFPFGSVPGLDEQLRELHRRFHGQR